MIDIYDSARNTGRTQRMLEEVIAHCQEGGKHVCVVSANVRHGKELARRMGESVEEDCLGNFLLGNNSTIHFYALTAPLPRAHRFSRLFWDHYTWDVANEYVDAEIGKNAVWLTETYRNLTEER